jgi:hypothetical protein
MFPNSPAASTKPARIRSTAASSLPATRADPDDPKQWKLWLVTSSVKKVNRALRTLLKAPTSPSKASIHQGSFTAPKPRWSAARASLAGVSKFRYPCIITGYEAHQLHLHRLRKRASDGSFPSEGQERTGSLGSGSPTGAPLPEKGRPTSRKALESTIQSVFDHSLNSDVVEKAIALLIHEGVTEISESGKVEYPQSLR